MEVDGSDHFPSQFSWVIFWFHVNLLGGYNPFEEYATVKMGDFLPQCAG